MDLHDENRALAPRIATARLTLRPLVLADAAPVVAALNDWSVTQWLTNVPFPYSADDAAGWIAASQRDIWAIDAGTGLIGVIDVLGGDLGYWLAPGAQGHGYMKEAARAVVAAYFTQNDLLVSGYYPANAPSRTVLRGLGFRDTHVAMHDQIATGRAVPCQRMQLTRQDWLDRVQ
ncbi:Protein N-acetyltransferase, RimJ/RimL family [Loktanella sp. DSM 29012]|uniref:GNAT family N-acetyltransferase n=1 Tax=Loktanella sp. DSM 29012 TaxID=1881056 RepID=UPI0008CC6662|nr:GNAT family N-acetyltransferase [Loktanella sp. DSM 29012]SEQ20469.1 Protein N-acetyltransferase, RimJ/RimL family [Loktanella sp. DSM 29012]